MEALTLENLTLFEDLRQSANEGEKIAKERNHLLGTFPEEIWHTIFQRVGLSDLENVSNSSLFLRQLLSPERTVFLFPQVWKVLGIKYERCEDDCYFDGTNTAGGNEWTEVVTVEGHIMRVKRKGNRSATYFQTVTTLRLVCGVWRNSINEFYQNLPDHYQMKEDPHFREWEDAEQCYYFLKRADIKCSWEQVEFMEDNTMYLGKFIGHFEKTHFPSNSPSINPFLSKKVTIEYSYRVQQHLRLVTCLVKKYGQHIWYCTVLGIDDFPSRFEYYRKLRELLQMMPNLKILEIRYHRGEPVNSRELNLLQAHISLLPLPALDHLEFIKTEILIGPIFNELLRSNNHVSMLQVNRACFYDDYDIYGIPLQNLSQLSMEYFALEDFKKIQHQQVNWPLTKLYMDFSKCPFIPWSSIFSVLESCPKWADTLTNVAIKLPVAKEKADEKIIMKEGYTLRLKFPNVKRLKIDICNFSCLDFILPMKDSLEILDVNIYCDMGKWCKKRLAMAVEKKQTIQFVGFIEPGNDGERKSNIWSLFPKLKRFKAYTAYDVGTGRRWYSGSTNMKIDYTGGATRKQWAREMEKNFEIKGGE